MGIRFLLTILSYADMLTLGNKVSRDVLRMGKSEARKMPSTAAGGQILHLLMMFHLRHYETCSATVKNPDQRAGFLL